MSVELPFSEINRRLPLWACVGFAARCARREIALAGTTLAEADGATIEAAIEKAEEASSLWTLLTKLNYSQRFSGL